MGIERSLELSRVITTSQKFLNDRRLKDISDFLSAINKET